MFALLSFFLRLLASPFKSASRQEAENTALRHQLMVLQQKVRGRVDFMNGDRLFFILLYRWFPSIVRAIMIFRPETLVAGIGLAFVATGAGSLGIQEVGRQSMRNCVY
jgi:hypothetical protein